MEEIKIPKINFEKHSDMSFVSTIPTDVLVNLKILVESKEFSNCIEPDLSMQETVNMSIFTIQIELELLKRQYEQSDKFLFEIVVKKLQDKYNKIFEMVEEENEENPYRYKIEIVE